MRGLCDQRRDPQYERKNVCQKNKHLRPSHARLALQPVSGRTVFPPRRGLGGAARENSDYLVCGAARTRRGENVAQGPRFGPAAFPEEPQSLP